jgi:hypothetical protein
VPKYLPVKQKANQLETWQDFMGRLEIEADVLDKVITRDK